MAEKRVLVTGGAGFVGSHLTHKLLASGWQVGVFDNFSTGKRQFLPSDDLIEIYQGDLRNPQEVQQAILSFQPEVVFHLAAIHYIPYCNAHPDETTAVNVEGSRILLEKCSNSKVQKIIFASTAAVYPIRNEANQEESDLGPTDIYGRTKLEGEHLVQAFHAKTGIPVAIARLFNVFGPCETNPHVIPSILEQIKRGDTSIELGNLEPKRDYIHADDVARAFMVLEQHTHKGCQIYNVGTGIEYSVQNLVDTISAVIGYQLSIRQSPNLIRGSDRLHLKADISKITALTDWQPKYTILQGLRQLIAQEYPVLVA